jgi:hypothetical protein
MAKHILKQAALASCLLLAIPSIPAVASQWGCQCLLCLANPGGPTQFDECKPPIEKLYAALAHGAPFPPCDLSDGNDSNSNYAKQVVAPWDPCPAGTNEVDPGALVAQGVSNGRFYTLTSMGVSEGTNYNDHGYLSGYGPKACVGNLIGYQTIGDPGRDGDQQTYAVYDKVTWFPAKSPSAIDVYVNGKFSTRVHY